MIAIFDIGKTNKKFILFDKNYEVVEERTTTIPDQRDEDGFVCADEYAMGKWMKRQLEETLLKKGSSLAAINFSTYGATLVHLNKEGQLAAPVYDYLKPLKKETTHPFYQLFGGRIQFSLATGSPALQMLNSGIQLYWLKHQKPELFYQIESSLHLPQYFNFIFSGKRHADYTSIGCHTGLWDYNSRSYHSWLKKEGLQSLLPAPENFNTVDLIRINGKELKVGIGIHDSSAALLPFVLTAKEPFVLLSTGTWTITLNPYFKGGLTKEQYEKDCLYYLLNKGRKVAASRLFLGNEYDFWIKKISSFFDKKEQYLQDLPFRKALLEKAIKTYAKISFYPQTMEGTGPHPHLSGTAPDLSLFDSAESAYYKMMLDLVSLQKESIYLVNSGLKNLYVTGGFLKNAVFMTLLQAFLPDWNIYLAENKRASALGAAVAIHDKVFDTPLPDGLCKILPFKSKFNKDLSGYHLPEFK